MEFRSGSVEDLGKIEECAEIRKQKGIRMDISFFKNRKVLITGHNGFKGSWMCKVLKMAGADLAGYSLTAVPKELFDISMTGEKINSCVGDIRDIRMLQSAFEAFQPEIVIHMAAQPIVREAYKNPAYTYEVNVLGTINVLECVRRSSSVKSFVNVTTDKVYRNQEWEWGYRENEVLDGYDPYSNSKSCSELITGSYKRSFFQDSETAISTVRAGNVIGGGDFSTDRIIPDCIHAALNHKPIEVRNPDSVRPYQHVLEPVMAYLLVAKSQYENRSYEGCYNIGPSENDCRATKDMVTLFCNEWNKAGNWQLQWNFHKDGGPHEAKLLKLDCSKMKTVFGWEPCWNAEIAIKKTVDWAKIYQKGGDISQCMEQQIEEYLQEMKRHV